VVISAFMYKCKVFPYPITSRRPEKVMPAAYEFIRVWQAECSGSHPHVLVKCFGEPRIKVYIEPGLRHVDEKRYVPNIARRYRFLPCVKELLTESEERPVSTKDGNLMLEGKAPTKERFKVVIGPGAIEDGQQTYKLVTFYPVTK
jgi:hypothetical protein